MLLVELHISCTLDPTTNSEIMNPKLLQIFEARIVSDEKIIPGLVEFIPINFAEYFSYIPSD